MAPDSRYFVKCGSNDATLAAKAATATIPIVFGIGDDPIQLGLRQPCPARGNATGINYFSGEVIAKRLRLLHDLVPKAVRIAVLVNPANATERRCAVKPSAFGGCEPA
jgi:putative ABC transport system substrate-binding protein